MPYAHLMFRRLQYHLTFAVHINARIVSKHTKTSDVVSLLRICAGSAELRTTTPC